MPHKKLKMRQQKAINEISSLPQTQKKMALKNINATFLPYIFKAL